MTITKAQHDALMADRSRPFTDRHMNNAKAIQQRIDASAINMTNDTVDTLAAVMADPQRRRTADKPITVAKPRKPKEETAQ